MRDNGDMSDALERARRMAPEISEIGRRYGVSNIRIFGSAARGEASESSDMDLLVDIDKSRSLLDLSGFYLDVRDLLGVDVDVVTDGDHLGERFRARIHREAVPL